MELELPIEAPPSFDVLKDPDLCEEKLVWKLLEEKSSRDLPWTFNLSLKAACVMLVQVKVMIKRKTGQASWMYKFSANPHLGATH